MRNNLISKFIITLTLVAFLTVSVGKVNRVFALADLSGMANEFAPVYDTTIIQFSDYVENTLTESQGDIVYFLIGLALYANASSSDYDLVNPNSSEGGVINWLKDCGSQLYNSIIHLGVGRDPITGVDLTPQISALIAHYMGYAVKASQYNNLNEFISAVHSATDKFVIPLTYDSMFNLNQVLSSQGGLYNWQQSTDYVSFDDFPFVWSTSTLSPSVSSGYYQSYNSMSAPRVRFNVVGGSLHNGVVSYNGNSNSFDFTRFNNIFVNTTLHSVYICDDDGLQVYTGTFYNLFLFTFNNDSFISFRDDQIVTKVMNYDDYDTLGDLYSALVADSTLIISGPNDYFHLSLSDWIHGLYIGSSWEDRQPWSLNYDLNLSDTLSQYLFVPESEILLDIKGLLEDLIDTTDLRPTFINNIYNPDGSGIDIEDLIKVSVNAIIEAVADPPIPVNLNDIAVYTENDYLVQLKEHAHDFSDTIGSYVAFWHNVDYEFVYTVLGGVIIVMIGAFIGKWGHS